jgi:hypothetical protein
VRRDGHAQLHRTFHGDARELLLRPSFVGIARGDSPERAAVDDERRVIHPEHHQARAPFVFN